MKRPVRSDIGRKTSQGTNKQVSSGNKASRSLRPDQQQMPLSSNKNGSTLSSSGDMNREFDPAASSTFEIEDVFYDSHYELLIETVPPPRSGVGDQEEGEVDSMTVDYYVARSIREAAQSSDSGEVSPANENTETSSDKLEQSGKIAQPSGIEDDPFAYMEDIQPIGLPEQRASTIIHDIDQGIPDISDVPTDVHDVEVEDLGDDGEVMLQPDLSPHAWADQMLKESGVQETPRIYGMPPRSSRVGNSMRPSLEDLGNEDDLLPPSIPIPDQPTRVTPSSPARASGASTPSSAAKLAPQPIIQPSRQERNVSTNPTVQQSKKPLTTKSSRVVTTPPLNSKAGSNSNRNGKRNLAIVSISLGALLLALLLFVYFGSNAPVTIVVHPHPLLPVSSQYVASTNPQNSQQNTIPSQVLKYPASVSGQGTATGTIKQGNQVATGTVTFSNNGSNPLDIPTGTVLSTSGPVPVQFVTVADVLVQSDKNTNAIPSVPPVQTQMTGESGNVAANSITLIPPDSLSIIAKNNNLSSLAAGILTVTNPDPTIGGGSSNVPTVTSSDVNTLTVTLQQQEQSKINAWVTNLKNQGYEVGTPEENVITTPAVGQPAPGGKFTGVLHVKVLVIRNSDIQAKGIEQFKAAALHLNPPSVPANHSPTVTPKNNTPSQDGTTLTITVNATGHVVQQVSAQQISQQLAGMSIDRAKSFITSGQAGIKGVVATTIVHFPPFLGFMPFRAEQIHLVVQPGPTIGTTNG